MSGIVGMTAPYLADNGHTMTAPIVEEGRPRNRGKARNRSGGGRASAAPTVVWSWAECTADCRACAYGDDIADYAGEEW